MGRIRTIKPEFFGSQVVDPSERRLPFGWYLLYRVYDESGDLLYLGITGRPEERFALHRRKAKWWPLIASISTELIQEEYVALRTERSCIASEKPKFNVRSVKR